jgi:hypothetical protein
MEMTKEFFVGEGWAPAGEVLSGDCLPEWFYKEKIYPTDKKKQIYLDNHAFNLPVESRSIVFRWIIPTKPNLYSAEWEVPADYRMASVMRLTTGEWFGLTEHDLKEVRDGRASIPKEKLALISKMLQKSFLFNGLKIPYLEVRWDTVSNKDLDNFVLFHTGRTAEQAVLIANTLKDDQEKQKTELLRDALSTLQSKPNYLSILRDVVAERISVETAIQMTDNSGVFQKGI